MPAFRYARFFSQGISKDQSCLIGMLSRKYLLGLTLDLVPILILVTMWIVKPTNIILNEKDYEGVIFDPDNAVDVLRFMLLHENMDEAYWSPSRADISRVEIQLTNYVREKLPSLEGQIVNYKRQFLVFTAMRPRWS